MDAKLVRECLIYCGVKKMYTSLYSSGIDSSLDSFYCKIFRITLIPRIICWVLSGPDDTGGTRIGDRYIYASGYGR